MEESKTRAKPVKRFPSIKQRKFAREYVKTGNATEAVIKAGYNVANRKSAQMIGSDNLSKPMVIKALADYFPDDYLADKHKMLLEKTEEDGQPETNAVKAGLDMAYKLKGAYAPEKRLNVQVEVLADEDFSALISEYSARREPE